jgi:DNA-binding NtrC family response regulator
MSLNLETDTPRILVADDEDSMRFLLREVMRREGYEVEVAADGEKAMELVRAGSFDLVIMDVRMPGMDGMQALKEMRRIRPNLVVVMITAHGNTDLAIQAMREGAYDYFNKPFELEELRIVVRRALEKQALLNQVATLESKLRRRAKFDRIIGQSDPMQQVFALLERVVTNDINVLITGESGTGKEIVAQAVHYQSARRDKPFISVNCAAIPESLLESELFGHERGSFTGAIGTHIGKFESADGGSIFLDEIGDMPLPLQVKLLRVLQEREVCRIGGRKPLRVDIRIITATNRDLLQEVTEKRFREDLYFRLNVLPIHLPPLRKRASDIPLLVENLLGVLNGRLSRHILGVAPDAMQALMNYPWPGNVRELENVLQRSMVMAGGTLLQMEDLPPQVREAQPRREPRSTESSNGSSQAREDCGLSIPPDFLTNMEVPLANKMEQLAEIFEKELIINALEKNDGRRQPTADMLGISRKSLHNKMAKYELYARENATEDK